MKDWSRCCSPSPAACSPPSRDKSRKFIRTAACSTTSPTSSNGRLACVTELHGLIGGQLNDEPAASLQRDAHHNATALLGHLERAIARPRLHRRHAASPSSTHSSCDLHPVRPRARAPGSNNRVEPSPYYPVFERRMVM